MKFKKLIVSCLSAAIALTAAMGILTSAPSAVAAEQRINSIYGAGTYTVDARFSGYTIRQGTDVSQWQGNINWQGFKNMGTEFAFIRLGYRGTESGGVYLDPKFHQNMQNAINAGIPVGVYFYSQAINEAEARNEAQYCIDNLKGYKIDLPIIMDFEYDYSGRLYKAGLSREQTTRQIRVFLDTCSQAGYKGMLYANKNTLTNNIDTSQITPKYPVWLAHYTSQTDYTGAYDFWQYSSKGQTNYDECQYVDCDFWMVQTSITSLSFSESRIDINAGESAGFTVNAVPAVNSDNVTVTSSDPTVASVIGDKVYGVRSGTATLTATSTNGIKSSCTVTVRESLDDYTIDMGDSFVYTSDEITPTISVNKDTYVSGAVMSDGQIYTQPTTTSKAAANVAANDKVDIIGEVNADSKFYLVSTADGATGFIPSNNLSVVMGSVTLQEGTDYTASFSNNVNVGKATVTVSAASDKMTGSISRTFDITPCPLEDCQITQISPQNYSGAPLYPNVKIYNGSVRLIKGTDYTLSYSENVEIGTAKVNVTAIGNYSGSLDLTFSIVESGGEAPADQEVGKLDLSGMENFADSDITDASITFKDENGEEYDAVISDDGMISVSSLPTGTYSVTVSMKNYVPRTYEITVTESQPAELSAKLNLYGDISGDGIVTVLDCVKINAQIRGLPNADLDEYSMATADVSKDGIVTVLDYAKINAHIRGTAKLW